MPQQDGQRQGRAVEAQAVGQVGREVSERLPLQALAPGYGHNREAALGLLGVLEGRVPVDARMASAIRELAG